MTDTRLAAKLRIKPGQRIAVLGATSHQAALLGPLPAGVEVCYALDKPVDVVLCFATRMNDLRSRADRLREAIAPDGKLWVCYPKVAGAKKQGITSDVNRDTIWMALREHDLEGIATVSVDDVWSAMRFKVAS
jgi:hypothetical protein